jgi:hypothetical protein
VLVRGWSTLVWAVASAAAVLLASAACSSSSDGHAAPARMAPSTLPATVDGFFGAELTRQDHGSFGLDQVAIMAADDPRFGAVMRVRYPADSASQLSAATADTPHGGAQAYLAWTGGPVDEAYLRYYVRFPADFDFVKGGKLPGLYGGTVTSGRKIPDGTDGFSTRFMWRAKGAAEVYAYLPSSVGHGTSIGRGSWAWPTGVWVEVQQHVRLNRPGHADGQVRVWVNGVPVLSQGGLTFRTVADLRIEGLFFSTFFGGGDASWATPRDQHADFAGFALSTTCPDPC